MKHPVFGRFVFDADNARWRGYHAFKHLLPFGQPPEQKPPAVSEKEVEQMVGDMQAALEKIKDKMREQFGPEAGEFFAAMEEESERADAGEDEDEDDELEENAASNRDDARDKQDQERIRAGLFPLSIDSDDERGKPTLAQKAALDHLVANEASIAGKVMTALLDSYRQYSRDIPSMPEVAKPEGLTKHCQLLRVEVKRSHREGVAFLVFPVDCDWEIEHGMFVVYHPEKGAAWTTGDDLEELTESDDAVHEADEIPGNQELLDALYEGDDRKVQELIAQGHDVNDLGPDPYPPLCGAVESLELDMVKKLLAIGADPSLADFEGKTPLAHARRMLKDLTPRKGDRLMETGMALARKAAKGAFEEMQAKLEEIIRLLEAAAAR